MNQIKGKVTLENGIGIPDLLIALYDLDPETTPEEVISEINTDNPSPLVFPTDFNLKDIQGDRIGSVLSDVNGSFELSFEDAAFQIRNEQEKRPDYLLLILAPDKPGRELVSRILYLSRDIRQNAGRIESFLIHLSEKQLEDAGIMVPESPNSISIASKIERIETDSENLNVELKKIAVKRIKSKREEESDSNEKFKKFKTAFFEEISSFPKDVVNEALIAREPQEILKKSIKAIEDGAKTLNKQARKTHFFFTEEQQNTLDSMLKLNENKVLDSSQIESLLSSNPEGRKPKPSYLIRDDSVMQICLEKTTSEKCSEEYLGLVESENQPGSTETGCENTSEINDTDDNEDISIEQISQHVAKFITDATSPESQVNFGLHSKDSKDLTQQEQVQQSIDSFSIRKSPADTPAFHDFHQLHIAFDYVWKEFFDDNLAQLTEEVYSLELELGGDPNDDINEDVSRIDVLNSEAKLIDKSISGNEAIKTLFLAKTSNLQTNDTSSIGDNSGPSYRDLLPEAQGTGAKFGTDQMINPTLSLLDKLNKLLEGDYSFTGFAADNKNRSVNFGIITTYRQEWDPLNYQAGELVKTITLAPGEERKYTTKQVIKRKRSEKEVEKNSSLRKDEYNTTGRAESEIVKKAKANSNFELTSDGTYNLGFTKGKVETKIGRDSENTSAETKKDFHEAVRKAAHEYKNERTWEVNTEESFEDEFTESGVIKNLNEELTVAYLYYELQRRYRVNEKLHQVRPVVLVAQELPKPNQINDAWIVQHDWILRRVLLDDSFLPAILYLVTSLEGDQHALTALEENVAEHKALIKELKVEFLLMKEQTGRRYAALERAIEERAREIGAAEEDSFFDNLGEFFGTDEKESPNSARIREEAAKDAHNRAIEKTKELSSRIQREVTALNASVEKYSDMLAKYRNQLVQVARFRLHIKQNILHYMQAIWSHEPPDQRFLRLHQVQVPTIDGEINYKFVGKDETLTKLVSINNGKKYEEAEAHNFEVQSDMRVSFKGKTLAEVADLDNFLGFKGNYLIFPLQESNQLTDFMMSPYVDQGWSLIDPDERGNMNLDEFANFICCLHDNLDEDAFNDLKPKLKAQYEKLLKLPFRSDEEIIVPSGSLFIEALPGSHPLLEDFKLMHRAIDVKKAQCEVRECELENLRLAARLLSAEDNLELLDDPDVEKKIVVEGDKQNIIVSSDDT